MNKMMISGTRTLTLDTNGEYVFTSDTPITGKINKILVKFGTATKARIIITGADTTDIKIFDKTITKSGSIVSYEFHPVVQSCDYTGAAVSGEYDHPAVTGYLKYTISGGVANTTLSVVIFYE